MIRCALALVACALAAAPAPAQDVTAVAGKRVVFLGDSITQAGGYVGFTTYYLERLHPDKNFDVIGLGLASETLSGLSEDGHAGGKFPRPCLFERLGRVLEKAKPEVVVACYGMNDGIYLPLDKDRTAAFQKGVNKLIEQCKGAGAKQIFLVTPPIYDFTPKKGEFNYDDVLTEYAKWETELKTPGVTVIDLHTAMRKARDARPTPFSGDKVHPGDDGQLLIARTLLTALGVKLPDESLATIKADPLFKLVEQKRGLRSGAWMKHVGYTREKTVKPEPLGTAEADAAKIQDQINALRRAQKGAYETFPPADPPYYRVRYAPSDKPGELKYGVNYTVWVPPGVKALRGVVVHQHGCGEGSCKSGLTGAYDLHWQALAKKHDCALLSPAYEQPDKADCQMWCDPRNGSDAAFRKALADLGAKCGHPELATVPWALWGHSGGGHWAGGMVMLHPDRVAAAWLRSGVPLLKDDPERKGIKAHKLSAGVPGVPIMCNLGTKEGVTEKGKQFAGVWPANEAFFNVVRVNHGGLVGVAVDPLSSHDCGNQRYLAIPWLDVCIGARLPAKPGDPLRIMPDDGKWFAPPLGTAASAAGKLGADQAKAGWLPNEEIAKKWMEYVKDTKVSDLTPPPAPTNVKLTGTVLTWEAEADLESGLAGFVIERDGEVIATLPEQARNPFGRPLFQNLQYSDTPTQPLVPMKFTDAKAEPGKAHTYRVLAVNTVGLKSKPSAPATKP